MERKQEGRVTGNGEAYDGVGKIQAVYKMPK